MHEIRWNPLVKQWVIIAAHRADRPWRPDEREKNKCPFCPGAPEVKHLDAWDVVVLPNKYPALITNPEKPSSSDFPLYISREARGVAEVIVETPEHEGDFHTISLEHVLKIVNTYKEEFERLSSLDFIEYVAVFRNKGKEIGVSLPHPHSQIYALPFIPPRIKLEIESFKEYFEIHGDCMICDIVRHEIMTGKRVIYDNEEFMVLLPYYAMWPYELHVYSKNHYKSIAELDRERLRYLGDAVRVVTGTYSSLLKRDAPYIMVLHNHPSKGNYPYHFHVEFYQPYRDRDKLKYAAGIEWGFWVFTYDGVPEDRIRQVRTACAESISQLGDVLGVCH